MIKRGPLVLAITIFMLLFLGMFQIISDMGKASNELVSLFDRKLISLKLVDELRQSSDDLTRMARTYSVTGDPTYKTYFEQVLKIRNGSSPRPIEYNGIFWDFINPANSKLSQVKYGESQSLTSLMKKAGFTDLEIKKVEEATKLSNELADKELSALASIEKRLQNESNEFAKGDASDNLAQKLLHNTDYHRIKAKIMLPLKHLSQMLEARFQNETHLNQVKQSELKVWAFTNLVAILLLMLFGFFFFRIRNSSSYTDLVKSRNVPVRKFIIQLMVMISILFVSFVTWVAITDVERLERLKIGRHLQSTLITTNEVINEWAESGFYKINKISFNSKLLKMIKDLLILSNNKQELKRSAIHRQLRKHLAMEMKDTDFQRFCIITSNGISIASTRDKNIGSTNLIYVKRRSLFGRALKGETILVPPILSDVSVKDSASGNMIGKPTMFYLAPIKNKTGDIIAALAISLDPSQRFSRFTQMGSFDETGETYAFDENGLMISNNRFENQLRTIGLLKEGEHSALNIYSRNPGGNLLEGYKLPNDINSLPLTLMAASATARLNGINLDGYRDYRGVTVFGAWLWNKKLGIGVATEVDKDRAMQMFENMRFTILLVIITTVFILMLLGMLFIILERNSKNILKEGYDDLEAKVDERTIDLKDTIGALKSIQDELSASKELAENRAIALRIEQSLIQIMFDAIPDLVFIKNEMGIYQNCNDAFAKFVGVEKENIINFCDYDLFLKDVADFFVDKDKQVMGGSQALRNEEWVDYPNGHRVLLDTLKVPFFDTTGKNLGLLGISRDITDRNTAEEKILKSKEIAEEATQAKSDFLANMSHEIRTPLNAIIGMSNLALESKLDDKQRNYIEKVSISGESLLSIINDILDFSKIEAGKMDIEAIDFGIDEVLENFSNLVGFQANNKNIELLFDVSHDVPMRLVGDPLRVGQVLTNLGNNAVKFTQEGEIVVSIRVKKLTEKSITLHFTVSDTGIGMTIKQTSKLFHSFTQVDSSTSRKYGGTGLGLTISKKITEMMGGEIWVQSESGIGSTFHFTATFGRKIPESSYYLSSRWDILNGLNIMVVANNEKACKVLVDVISQFARDVKSATSGHSALSLIRSCAEPLDLIIMDQVMPEMDGIEVIQKIRDCIESPTPIILLTNYDNELYEDDRKELSYDAVLSKPIMPNSLIKSIMLALGYGLTETDNCKKNKKFEAIRRLRGARILLVEDNKINQELALELLRSRGILVGVANNGQEALDLLANEVFDGVLMDCMMPIMDGYETTQNIRLQECFKDLPVIAMSANAMIDDRDRAIESGMNDYITKPINVAKMFSTMDKWINSSNMGEKAQVRKNKQNVKEVPDLPGIDSEIGLESADGDIELYREVLCMCRDRWLQFDNEFRSVLKDKDSDGSKRMAHTLKGLAATIGAKDLQKLAYDLQISCCESSSDEEIFLLLENVNKELSFILAGLESLDSASS